MDINYIDNKISEIKNMREDKPNIKDWVMDANLRLKAHGYKVVGRLRYSFFKLWFFISFICLIIFIYFLWNTFGEYFITLINNREILLNKLNEYIAI